MMLNKNLDAYADLTSIAYKHGDRMIAVTECRYGTLQYQTWEESSIVPCECDRMGEEYPRRWLDDDGMSLLSESRWWEQNHSS